MPTAILKVYQLVGVVFYQQGEFFCQRHRLGKIADNILYLWFLFLGAHKAPFREKNKEQKKYEKTNTAPKTCRQSTPV
jgi:hypothetical protein